MNPLFGALRSLFGISFLLLPASSALGAERTAEQERALQQVETLETRPETPEARAAARDLMAWLAATSDLSVHACLEVVGDFEELERLPQQLAMQVVFSQAAYQIHHPEAGPRSVEVFLAGVQGTLRAYSAWKASHPDGTSELLERLLAMDESALSTYVAERLRECRWDDG